MRVDTMLRKEKEGSLFKDTKLAHAMMYSCLDEFLKIAAPGPVGALINEGESVFDVPLPAGQKKPKGQFPSTPALPLHDPPAPPEDTEPPQVFDGMNKMQSAWLFQLQKEAGAKEWAAKKGRGLLDTLTGAPIRTKVLDPATGEAVEIGARKPFQELGESLQESGRLMQSKPTVSGVHGLPKAPGRAQRVVGGGVEGMGESYNAEALVNPLGLPMGGFAGGLTKATARELAESGHPTVARVVAKAEQPARFLGETAGSAFLGAAGGINPAYAAAKSSTATVGLMAARRVAAKRAARAAAAQGGQLA